MRAFTLDDGTTALVELDGGSIISNRLLRSFIRFNIAKDIIIPSFTISFYGTGLDIVLNHDTPIHAKVDGLNIGYTQKDPKIKSIRTPVVSGLPLGMHTVTITT